MYFSVLFLYFLLSLCVANTSQPSPPPTPSLLEILTPDFRIPTNEAAATLLPADRAYQTPFLIRLTFLFALARYEHTAACHPTALSFFGVRDKIPASLCLPLPSIKIVSYINLRLHEQQYPSIAPPYADFLSRNSLIPESDSLDPTTEIGWANIVANRANKFLSSDGWNSMGDLSRKVNLIPYSDYTNYLPINPVLTPASRLKRPLRWQPLIQQSTGLPGQPFSQVHITPQLSRVRPYALSPSQLAVRKTSSPYKYPNSQRTISPEDESFISSRIDQLLQVSRNLTEEQRFAAFWWEDKTISLALFRPILSAILRLDPDNDEFLTMAEAIAQSDALVVAFREKRRHDLARPVTIIRRLRAGINVTMYLGGDMGVGTVPGEEVESLVQTQPHSEFPSLSAVLCAASLECIDIGFKAMLGDKVEIPNLVFPLPPGVFTSLSLSRTVTVNLSLSKAKEQCAQSRVWAGVHFQDAVDVGKEIGTGIGKTAWTHVAQLVQGKVPRGCTRCKGAKGVKL